MFVGLSLVFLAMIGMNPVFAQDAKEVNSGPKIKFETLEHDYGTIDQYSDGTCKFVFTNTGDKPLIISNAKGSCGCTIPSWPKEPIAPGASSVITVHYDTKRVGRFGKTVTLQSNATNYPTKVLRIKGEVVAKPKATVPVAKSGAPAN